MANLFDMIPDNSTTTSDPTHSLALASDTMGLDQNSIENDLWVNIVDVVILVGLQSLHSELPCSLRLPSIAFFWSGIHHHWGRIYLDKHAITGTQRKRRDS